MNSADVACKQLGFINGAIRRYKNSYFGYADVNQPIWLDKVRCDGWETDLDFCRHRKWGRHDCNHDMDVGVECIPNDDEGKFLED